MTIEARWVEELDEIIAGSRLLDHPFYQAWSRGALTLDELRDYACQYYAFEARFPRFLSSIHARCEDPAVRQALLNNLWDEEHGSENHLALWLRFCEGLGLDAETVRSSQPRVETQALLASYDDLCSNGSTVEGLAALYAYESQAPEVMRSKIAGLKAFYDIDDARTLSFFRVHQDVDEAHAGAEAAALDSLLQDDASRAAAREATTRARDALCRFLDGVPIGAAC